MPSRWLGMLAKSQMDVSSAVVRNRFGAWLMNNRAACGPAVANQRGSLVSVPLRRGLRMLAFRSSADAALPAVCFSYRTPAYHSPGPVKSQTINDLIRAILIT